MKHSCHNYDIEEELPEKWIYSIHPNNPEFESLIESDSWYDSKEEAIEYAEWHIDKLENGPNND